MPVAVTLALVAVSAALAQQGSPLTTERGQLRTYLDVFDETNLPTWWAATVLGGAALACGVVAALCGRGVVRRRWLLLAGLTTALSVDEATVLHERLDRAVLTWLSPEDFPYLWVVPGLVLGWRWSSASWGSRGRLPQQPAGGCCSASACYWGRRSAGST